MVRCKSVAVVAIVCLSIAGAMRMKQHQVSAVGSTDERSRMAPSVTSAATVETGRRRVADRTFDQNKKKLDKKCLQKKGKRREKQIEKLMTMSEEELRERCREVNLPDVGTKHVLVESLQAWAHERNKQRAADMSEEELRERCRLANLPDVGTKAELVESLRSLAYEKKMKRKGVSEQSSKESSLHDAQLAEEDVKRRPRRKFTEADVVEQDVEEDLTEADIVEEDVKDVEEDVEKGVEEDVEEEDIIADIIAEDADIAEARDDAQVREIQRAIEAVSEKFGMLPYLT